MRTTSSLRSRNDSLQFRTNSATPPEGHPTSYVRFALGGRRCPALHEQIRLPGGLFLLPLVAITLCERELWAREPRVTGGCRQDVRIGGGVSTIRQYLLAGQVDEMHLAMSPVLMGEGEHLFAGMNLQQLGFHVVRSVAGENATHIFIEKQKVHPT
jgi:riboflavin biosynthesis pyrimidine reductase